MRLGRHVRRVAIIAVIVTVMAALPALGQQPSVNYVYDALGRLVAVIDSASNQAAIYSYDAVGNLLSIARQSAAVVSIIEFNPTSGPVGTTVTIYGTGFSATVGQNTVSFNGTAATVISATPTQIVTSVPAGATTGAITVTAPGGSSTSANPFTVGTPGAPTITSFTPTIGTPGTTVTLSGSNFEPTTAGNRVAFNVNVARASVTSATASSIVTTVPTTVGSGRIDVATPGGEAVSADDFYVPPSPYTASDVGFTGRMAIGGSSLVAALGTANRIGLVVFDGVEGQRVSLGVTTTVTSNYISINKPDGSALLAPSLVTSGAFGQGFDLAPLPRTGTYTVVADPYSSYTGNTTLTLSEDLTGNLTINGAALALTFGSGQNGRFTFSGTAGQRVSLLMTAVTITQSTVSIYKPDGTVFTGPVTIWSGSGGTIDTGLLPVSGNYTVVVDPAYGYSGNMTLTLSTEITGTISLGGADVTASIGAPGQRARYTFDGVAGQRASLGVTNVTIGAGCCSVTVSVVNPDGTTLTSVLFGPAGTTLNFPAFPVTGTYAILVDPTGASTGNATLTLSPEVTGTLSVNGAGFPLTISRIGQNARLTFEGIAGQHVKLTLANVTMVQVYVSVLKPDGSTLIAPSLTFNGTTTLDLQVLGTTGTYTIFVDPYAFRTGSMTLTLFTVTP